MIKTPKITPKFSAGRLNYRNFSFRSPALCAPACNDTSKIEQGDTPWHPTPTRPSCWPTRGARKRSHSRPNAGNFPLARGTKSRANAKFQNKKQSLRKSHVKGFRRRTKIILWKTARRYYEGGVKTRKKPSDLRNHYKCNTAQGGQKNSPKVPRDTPKKGRTKLYLSILHPRDRPFSGFLKTRTLSRLATKPQFWEPQKTQRKPAPKWHKVFSLPPKQNNHATPLPSTKNSNDTQKNEYVRTKTGANPLKEFTYLPQNQPKIFPPRGVKRPHISFRFLV